MASSARAADSDPSEIEPLFCGKSIFTRLAESAFGDFSRALAGVDLPLSEGFSLPRVVVIGCEKSGKSTLLEALTKCSIFPRAEGAFHPVFEPHSGSP
jgi:ABC-type phosphate/phosphonate transport system ATPase subunit